MSQDKTTPPNLEQQKQDYIPETPAWRRWELWVYAVFVILTLITRLWDLDARAYHHDESLHALYSWYLSSGNGYTHNPMMHGPFQFHGTALIYTIFGDSNYTARLLPALFGVCLVVLPILLRSRLGRLGSLLTSALIVFSPTLLYFSRFARNDIYMAVWTLCLVAFLWRYLDTGRNRYIYLSALFLALLFATKESSYIVSTILLSYLFILATPDIVDWVRNKRTLSEFSRAGILFILYLSLSLPMWAAGSAIFQGFFGGSLILANNHEYAGSIGLPLGDGIPIAIGITTILFGISILIGIRWSWRVWLVSFVIYYTTVILLYTTFLTNLNGIPTGIWQSMGYWIAQQEVGRGGQPWYYYFVIGSVYESVALLFATIAAIYYMRSGNIFNRFLVFWCFVTLFLYTYASEKMPWLLVNVTLPMIVLSALFLSNLAKRIKSHMIFNQGGLFVILGVPLTVFFVARFILLDTATTQYWVAGIAAVTIIAILVYLCIKVGSTSVLSLGCLSLAMLLFLFGARSGVIAAFGNAGDPNGHGDVPVEMLVYTQSSPDIARIATEINNLARETGEGHNLTISIDGTDGFAWPWAWYLRHYKAEYPNYSSAPPETTPPSDIVIVNAQNQDTVRFLLTEYTGSSSMEHRWWFPEVYRHVTIKSLRDGLLSRTQWQKILRYIIHRDLGISLTALGSVDFYYYVDNDLIGMPSED